MHVINEKAAIIIAAVYGAFLFVAIAPMYLFSFQQPGSLLIRISGGFYIFTILPAALISIWWKKVGGIWMIMISIAAALALCIDEIVRHRPEAGVRSLVFGLIWWILISMIPGFIGVTLLTARKKV